MERSLEGYSPWSWRVGNNLVAKQQQNLVFFGILTLRLIRIKPVVMFFVADWYPTSVISGISDAVFLKWHVETNGSQGSLVKCLWVKIWPDLCSGLQVTSLMACLVKNPPAVQQIKEMRVQSLGWEDSLEKEMATQYFCLGNLMDRGAWRTTVRGVGRVTHDLATKPPQAPPGG